MFLFPDFSSHNYGRQGPVCVSRIVKLTFMAVTWQNVKKVNGHENFCKGPYTRSCVVWFTFNNSSSQTPPQPAASSELHLWCSSTVWLPPLLLAPQPLPVIYNQAVFCLSRVHPTSHSVALAEAASPYLWFTGKRYLWRDISDARIHQRTPQSGCVSGLFLQQQAKWGWWGRTNTKYLLCEALKVLQLPTGEVY